MRLFLTLILTASAILAQYAAIQSTDYPANSLGILNAKPTLRTGAVAPTGNCTAGLDMYVDTVARELYFCGSLNVWTKSGSVASVFGRSGAVTATSGDYTAAQVTNAVDSTATYANPSWITSLAWAKLTGLPTFTNTVFGRSGTVVATSGDYTAAQVTNAVDSTQTYSDPGFISALSASKLTSGFIPLARIGQNGATTGQAFVWNGSAWAPATISGAGGYGTIESNGSALTQRSIVNLVPSADIGWSITDQTTKTQVQALVDATKWSTRANVATGIDSTCIPTSASATTFTCSPIGIALPSYTNGMRIMFRPDVTLSGNPTLNISTIGTKYMFAFDRSTPASGTAGSSFIIVYDDSIKTTTVNTSGTSVTGTAGAAFTADMVNTQIKIGSTFYTVSAFTNSTSITLGSTAGTQTGVTLAAGGWVFPGSSGGTVTSVSGTTNEITSSGGATPVLSLSSVMNLTSKTVRVPNSTTLPATCTVGDSYMDTDATSGSRWFLCESTNTWVAQGAAGGVGTTGTINLSATAGLASGTITSPWATSTAATRVVQYTAAGLYGIQFDNSSAGSDPSTEAMITLPGDFNSSGAMTFSGIVWDPNNTGTTLNVQVAVACTGGGDAVALPTYNANAIAAVASVNNGTFKSFTTASITYTGCAAGEAMSIRLSLDRAGPNTSNNIRMIGMRLNYVRQ